VIVTHVIMTPRRRKQGQALDYLVILGSSAFDFSRLEGVL